MIRGVNPSNISDNWKKKMLRDRILDKIFQNNNNINKEIDDLKVLITKYLDNHEEKTKIIEQLTNKSKNLKLNLDNCVEAFFQNKNKPCQSVMRESFRITGSKLLNQNNQTKIIQIGTNFLNKVNKAIRKDTQNNTTHKKVILGPIEFLHPFLQSDKYIVLCMQDTNWTLWQNFRFILCKRKPGESIYMILPNDLFHGRITFLEILFLLMDPNTILSNSPNNNSKIHVQNSNKNSIKKIELCKRIKKTQINDTLLLLEFQY